MTEEYRGRLISMLDMKVDEKTTIKQLEKMVEQKNG